MFIQSTQNVVYKHAKSMLLKKNRYREKKYLLEGYRFIKSAVDAGETCETLFLRDSHKDKYENVLDDFQTFILSNDLFDTLSNTENSQGVIGLMLMPQLLTIKELITYIEASDDYRALILDALQDPGNLGTIIRTAEAAGFHAVLMTKGTVDPFNDKTIRSAAGALSSIKLMFLEDEEVAIQALKEAGCKLIATALRHSVDYCHPHVYGKKCAIVIGNEANGVSSWLLDISDARVKIPILGKSESLNASVAAGIIMYKSLE